MKINEVPAQIGALYDNAFIEYLNKRIGEDAGQDQLEAWESLPEALKEYHALFNLDGDVFNGGFGQYLRRYAWHPPYIAAAIRGLERVAGHTHAKLACEAISLYVHYIPELQPLMDSHAIPPSPRLEESDIDARFREAGDLQKLRFAWLETNRDLLRGLKELDGSR
jgi:hypothetical protein